MSADKMKASFTFCILGLNKIQLENWKETIFRTVFLKLIQEAQESTI